jgi:hypothetical protein
MDIPSFIALAVALLLGLGIPKAFSLLYLGLVGAAFWLHRYPGSGASRLLIWSMGWMVLFGLSYAAFQVGWAVWNPPSSYVAEILAVTVLPAAGLWVGWLLHRRGQSFCTALILAYVGGALVYSLASLALSRIPWWNVTETFVHVVRVPWGHPEFLSTRAVEQRAFLSLVLLPIGLTLATAQIKRCRYLGALMLGMAFLAAHVSWAMRGRIGLAALAISLIPLLWLFGRHSIRWIVLLISGFAMAFAIGSGYLCDERPWLVGGFLARLLEAPWGGRLIQYSYADCNPQAINQFGSFPGSSSFTPHNLVLDVYNDAGWIPALCLLIAILPICFSLLVGFWRSISVSGWTWPLALRWSFVSVLVVEWLAQPFLYTDQLMFTVGFVAAGIFLAEFNEKSTRASAAIPVAY